MPKPLTCPAAFERLERYAFQLAGAERSSGYLEQVPFGEKERDSLRKAIRTQILEAAPSRKDVVDELASNLFPNYARAVDQRHRLESQPTSPRSRRIFDPDRISTYFHMTLPEGRLSFAEEDRIITSLRDSHSNSVGPFIRLELLALDQESLRIDLLKALPDELSNFDVAKLENLADGLVNRRMEYQPFTLGASETSITRNLIFQIASEVQGKGGDGPNVLVSAILSGRSLALAADLFFYTANFNRTPRISQWADLIDQEKIKRAFAEKVEVFKSNFGSLFELRREEALHVMYRWTEADEADAKASILLGLGSEPRILGRFVLWMQGLDDMNQRWANLDRFISPAHLCGLLEVNEESRTYGRQTNSLLYSYSYNRIAKTNR